LVDELILNIFKFLRPQQLAKVGLVCKEWLRISSDPILWKSIFDQYYPGININTRSITGWKHIFNSDRDFSSAKLICFHTKASYKDCILGIPISYSINPRSQQIDKITSTLDLLSYTAYHEDGIRKSVWKQRFTHFLPLYITAQHANRALPIMKKIFLLNFVYQLNLNLIWY